MEALPYNDSRETYPPCADVRWAQVVAAYDTGGRPSVVRLLRKREQFDGHACCGGVPRTAARAPVLRAIAKSGNLGVTALPGAAIHQTIRRRASNAGYDPTTALTSVGVTRFAPASSPKRPATMPAVPLSPRRLATRAWTGQKSCKH